jgi:hypothetical protein
VQALEFGGVLAGDRMHDAEPLKLPPAPPSVQATVPDGFDAAPLPVSVTVMVMEIEPATATREGFGATLALTDRRLTVSAEPPELARWKLSPLNAAVIVKDPTPEGAVYSTVHEPAVELTGVSAHEDWLNCPPAAPSLQNIVPLGILPEMPLVSSTVAFRLIVPEMLPTAGFGVTRVITLSLIT